MNLEIKAEEAALGDFKRTATKIWMGLKFGGLVECCEKGAVSFFFFSFFFPLTYYISTQIAGKFGKLIIAVSNHVLTRSKISHAFNRKYQKELLNLAQLGMSAIDATKQKAASRMLIEASMRSCFLPFPLQNSVPGINTFKDLPNPIQVLPIHLSSTLLRSQDHLTMDQCC